MTLPLPEHDRTTDGLRGDRTAGGHTGHTGHTVLAGRYELLGVVGRGGMADVHRAHDRDLDRVVAVKLLPADRRGDPDFTVRLRREARAAAALAHPHAVGVFDVGVQDGDVFVVLEYVEGATLRAELSAGGRLAAADATEAGVAVCEALAAAHDRGIVHRDVNPANVMRCGDGTIKLMDFGIARQGDAPDGPAGRTGTGMVLGTAAYLAPEQVRCEELDGRADLYALGCTLYELVTGVVPFGGDSDVEVAARRLREPPTPPRGLVPALPAGLEAVILRALARRPEDRHEDARAMAADLRATLHPGPEAAGDAAATTAVRTVAAEDREGTTVIAPTAGASEPWSWVRVAGLVLVGCALAVLVVVAVIELVR